MPSFFGLHDNDDMRFEIAVPRRASFCVPKGSTLWFILASELWSKVQRMGLRYGMVGQGRARSDKWATWGMHIFGVMLYSCSAL